MSISGAISSALSGLAANGRQLSVTSGNIANALTEGFGARDVTLSARSEGGGVRVVSVGRSLDPALTGLRREADADAAEASVLAEGTARLSDAFGVLGGPLPGLFEQMTAFENALSALADTPESAPRQGAVLEAAQRLATGFNDASRAAASVREDADTQIGDLVRRTNAATEEVAALNRAIVRSDATGRETAALVDRRETLIDEISATLPVRVTPQDDGSVTLRTAEGVFLAGLNAREIAFTPTPVIGPEMVYDNGAGALSGLSVAGVDITPGGPGAQSVRGGALAGAFALRDTVATDFAAGLDALAEELVTRLADPSVDPMLAPGAPGLFTDAGGAPTAPATPGIAGRLAVNAAVDPSQGGELFRLRDGIGAAAPGPVSDDSVPRGLIDVLKVAAPFPGATAAPGTLSLSNRIAALGEAAATARVAADTDLSAASAARGALAGEEAALLGVDTDRELQKLIEIEQAYAANARVISTAEAMLDELRRIG
ncbi:MAG: flagellar hook-associated protein FlgK [Pseudomonadota bacterium]